MQQDNEFYEKLLSSIDEDFNKANDKIHNDEEQNDHRVIINKLKTADDILNEL